MDFAANTHIIAHAGRTLADSVEAGPLPYELSAELDTLGLVRFRRDPARRLPRAHQAQPDATGELHAIAYFWAWDHVQHVVVGPAGKVTATTDIPVPDGPMMHDFALTDRYVVLADLPVTFSLNAVSQGKELPYAWVPGHQARVGLLPRDGSTPARWIGIDPCWVFHCLNAYDDDYGRVAGRPVPVQRVLRRLHPVGPRMARLPWTWWTIDPAAWEITQQRLDDRGQEFPRVYDRIISRPHRYGYSAVIGEVTRAITAAVDFGDDAFTNAILRHDLKAGMRRRTSSAATPPPARPCSRPPP